MKDLPADLADLIDFDAATLRVTSREGKHREFKRQAAGADLLRFGKTLAAFANTDGGVLLFGVSDAPRHVVGIEGGFPDEADWANVLAGAFAPEIEFTVREYAVSGRTVVAIGVDRASDPPIACLRDSSARRVVNGRERDVTLLQQGAIYYRQAGQTRTIRHLELRAMLERRDAARLAAFMQNLRIISEVGPDRIGILDMSTGVGDGGPTKLYLSRETARRINFIERGRFVESADEGDPAYMVVGSVQLYQALAGPLDPEDQNLPKEAAATLRPVVEEVFWAGMPFTEYHVTKLAIHLGLRGDGPADPRYCIVDDKVNRVYYTRAGIARMADAVRRDPQATLASFASRPNIARFEAERA